MFVDILFIAIYKILFVMCPLYFSRFWVPAESALSDTLKDVKLADDSVTVCSKLKERGGKERPLVTPIYQTSTYVVESVQHYLDILKDVKYRTYTHILGKSSLVLTTSPNYYIINLNSPLLFILYLYCPFYLPQPVKSRLAAKGSQRGPLLWRRK